MGGGHRAACEAQAGQKKARVLEQSRVKRVGRRQARHAPHSRRVITSWAAARRRLYATEQGLTQLGVGSGVAPSAESGGGSGAASPAAASPAAASPTTSWEADAASTRAAGCEATSKLAAPRGPGRGRRCRGAAHHLAGAQCPCLAPPPSARSPTCAAADGTRTALCPRHSLRRSPFISTGCLLHRCCSDPGRSRPQAFAL